MPVPFADLQLQYQNIKGEIDGAIAAGSIVKVAPSVSAKTTLAPAWVIIADVDIHECAVVMASSPGATFSAAIAR